MEKAKQTVSGFLGKAGHHDTTVHEKVAPSVTRETVTPSRHEERQIATDREVHQDHHHTTVQPVQDREVLPEQHHHNLIPTEHRTHDHRNEQETTQRLQTERAQFVDESNRAQVKHTQGTAPNVSGEHIHHHVHETIQPVVHKETVEPHVVHTTVPVHETHHNAAQHHSATALPAVTMAEFQKGGGVLTGREERSDRFDGEPKGMSHLGHHGSHNQSGTTGTTGTTGTSGLGRDNYDQSGTTGTSGLNSGRDTYGSETGTSQSGIGSKHNPNGFGTDPLDSRRGTSGTTGSNLNQTDSAGTQKKASLMDKLNPKVDADGDGKAGFMK